MGAFFTVVPPSPNSCLPYLLLTALDEIRDVGINPGTLLFISSFSLTPQLSSQFSTQALSYPPGILNMQDALAGRIRTASCPFLPFVFPSSPEPVPDRELEPSQ